MSEQIKYVPTVETQEPFPYVGIEVKASLKDWGTVNACLPELLAWLGEHGHDLAGAPFYRIVKAGSDVEPFTVIVGAPVAESVAGDDRVRPYDMPGGTYATYLLTAWFDEIWKVHDSVNRWAAAEDVRIDRDGDEFVGMYEQYLTKPEEVTDRNQHETLIAYKLAE